MTANANYRHLLVHYRYQLAAGALAVTAGLLVFLLAHELFPYHSSNHDEGVYLQQAAMLLEGRLWLTPGSDAVREAVHPWFFVESDRGFYSKYSPVPAAIFAAGKLLGGARLALAGIATANIALGYAVTAEAFDRSTGLLAAVIMTAAPLFLVTSAVFLPYAPTTALNLLFALAYIRAVRRHDHRYAVLAGSAIGLSFFARPYTAVLFALPFILHASWRLTRLRADSLRAAQHYGLIAAIGLVWVAVALAYNALMTGDPLLFPYEAFAPQDGLGFGYRSILGHETIYSPTVAITANLTVLSRFAQAWFTAGVFGTLTAIAGVLLAIRTLAHTGIDSHLELSDSQLHLVLLGLIASVIIGNLFFWGNLNILGEITDPTDGLITIFGPFYHFDLLLPLAAFAGHGLNSTITWLDSAVFKTDASKSGITLLLGLMLIGAMIGGTASGTLGPPIEKNAAYTDKYAQAYAPFTTTQLTNALVFLPPTYGEWRNHPFQWLRNTPGLDGPAVYVLSRSAPADYGVIDEYPDRTLYRYRYRGEWTPDPDNTVEPLLERTELHTSPTVRAQTTVTIPDRITSVRVSLTSGESLQRSDSLRDPPNELTVHWSVSPDELVVGEPTEVSESTQAVPIPATTEIALIITLIEPSGGTLTYREAVRVRPMGDRVQVIWPPASTTCLLTTNCGLEGTYLPDQPDTRPAGITMNTTRKNP